MRTDSLATTVAKSNATKGDSLSLRKAIRILRLFSGDRDSLALKEIAAATEFPKTVCHRLLATLVAERFCRQDPVTRRYMVGPDLVSFARFGLGPADLRNAALPELFALAKASGDVALLHTLYEGSALCIDRKDGDYPVRTAGVQVGDRLPLHCGGGPFALLSFAPPAIANDVLSKPLEGRTERTVVDGARIRRRIAEVRARGYAIGDEDAFDYVVAVAAPIFGHQSSLIGALSVGGIKPRYTPERIAAIGQMVKAAAARVSERLGYGERAETRAVAG